MGKKTDRHQIPCVKEEPLDPRSKGSVINGAMLSAVPPCQDFEAVGSH